MESSHSQKLVSDLTRYIKEKYSPQEKLKVSKDGSQTLFFRKAGKSLCYIQTKDKKSMVTVVIGSSLSDKVQEAPLSQKTKEMFKNAKQVYDGKWLFFEIKTNSDLVDIKTLLTLKRPK
ncbi:hypothetical protein A2801_02665 [Candidatus Woesebacteria bacterium RIFCSPHIGHO2_01_FULL_41_10]|uniref:DUF3788 domain-containing protein n=1 Tax=Candidatus Woesebacteria bacterium RIFCSPHIGHO2_01_FULL_41_10 TaxID=1802500 RepID=A0A1F7YND2_9BACT|nr:MAG: hypothetical protein A2801_02665 [Candidatus Woesebacteria bacterium RIFCSPHIGHO2_01_FULL_41_10]